MQHDEVCCPGEWVSVDIAGPPPESTQGNCFIVVFTDHFTKWTEAVATKDHTAQKVTRVMVDVWVRRYGCPITLHSDQGREFESFLFQDVCRLLRVEKTRTCPYRPQSNGQVERHNLQEVMMAYRTSVHAATGYTPAMMHPPVAGGQDEGGVRQGEGPLEKGSQGQRRAVQQGGEDFLLRCGRLGMALLPSFCTSQAGTQVRRSIASRPSALPKHLCGAPWSDRKVQGCPQPS